jgi:hypothetical protein
MSNPLPGQPYRDPRYSRPDGSPNLRTWLAIFLVIALPIAAMQCVFLRLFEPMSIRDAVAANFVPVLALLCIIAGGLRYIFHGWFERRWPNTAWLTPALVVVGLAALAGAALGTLANPHLF